MKNKLKYDKTKIFSLSNALYKIQIKLTGNIDHQQLLSDKFYSYHLSFENYNYSMHRKV